MCKDCSSLLVTNSHCVCGLGPGEGVERAFGLACKSSLLPYSNGPRGGQQIRGPALIIYAAITEWASGNALGSVRDHSHLLSCKCE